MGRIRLTQVFPFLLPLRKRQRKFCFYLKMRLDRNRYAHTIQTECLPYTVFSAQSALINPDSGFDLQYQYNKVFNLKLASQPMDHLVIQPGETFSFWQLVRHADRQTPYKEGLVLSDGKIQPIQGGGLCQLSNTLFWLFLHSPLTVIERHGHAIEAFPTPNQGDIPPGVDATVSEGWLDLKVRNQTDLPFQLIFSFDEETMSIHLLTTQQLALCYHIEGRHLHYTRKKNHIYEQIDIYRQILDRVSRQPLADTLLYHNRCEIQYALPAGTPIEEEIA